MLEAYNGKCVIPGCDAEDALEAAHIRPIAAIRLMTCKTACC